MDSNSIFINTKAASEILSLSVGTIQKLVDSGEFYSYKTQGGHRRISLASVNGYREKNFIPIFNTSNRIKTDNSTSILLIHKKNDISSKTIDFCKKESVKTITDPIELLNLDIGDKTIFIDARISWINWMEIDFEKNIFSKCCVYIYNSELLSEQEAAHLKIQLKNKSQLIQGEVSSDLLFGYLLFNQP